MVCPYRFASVLVLAVCGIGHSAAQNSPQPTIVRGLNQIVRGQDAQSFTFTFNGIALYRYTTVTGGTSKGSFVGLSASRNGQSFFVPSMCGGVEAVDGMQVVYPCDGDISYSLANQFYSADSVALLWRVQRQLRQIYSYWMSFHIAGRTLIIDIVADGDDRNCAGMTLGEAGNDRGDMVVVPVPYLTLTSLLYQKSSGTFVSMFFDWERTNCSRLLPLSGQGGHILFASSAEYFPRTDGLRNRLRERIYLTVSNTIDDVLPNVVGPVAPARQALGGRIVLSYHLPYPWLLKSLVPNTALPTYLDSLKQLGVNDVALLIKDWWWSGFDRGNPRIMPANDYLMQRDGWDCHPFEREGGGGNSVLFRVRDKARANGYLFGLHQNYVDMYADARPGSRPQINVDSSLLASLPETPRHRAWAYPGNCRGQNAWAVKPSRVLGLAREISSAIYAGYNSDWNYLDVTTSVNPSGPMPVEGHGPVYSVVDFDASANNPARDSAGMFLYTLHQYRNVAGAVRSSTGGGPVEGEGGNHFLYAGYFDDFEARIRTAVPEVSGYSAPLLVDFHLDKLRSRSSYHGAGHIFEFYNRGWGASFSEREVLTFIATELAYGHGGLVTKSAFNCTGSSPCDHSLVQFAVENKQTLPLQKLLVDAQPVRIQYFDAGGFPMTGSRYIASYPDAFADIRSPNFMGRVRVEYDNGVVVYVNRNREAGSWTVTDLPNRTSYHYNLLRGGRMIRGVGSRPPDPVMLPAECGWVWYAGR